MNKIKLLIRAFFGISLILSLVGLAFAAWSEDGNSGVWTDHTLPEIYAGAGAGYLNYTWGAVSSLSDGEGVAVAIDTFVQAQGVAEMKYFYWSVELEGSGGSAYSLAYVEDWSFPWHGSKFALGAEHHSEEYFNSGGSFSQNVTYITEIFRIDSTHASIKYYFSVTPQIYNTYFEYDFSEVYLEFTENITVDSSVWTTPTVNLYMAHDGNGIIDMGIYDVQAGDISEYAQKFDTVPENNSWFIAIWDIVSGMFSVVIDIAIELTPVFPLILVCYFIDVLFTSFDTGSFTPIGQFFMLIFNAVVSAASFIADVVNAIIPL